MHTAVYVTIGALIGYLFLGAVGLLVGGGLGYSAGRSWKRKHARSPQPSQAGGFSGEEDGDGSVGDR